MNRDFTNLRRNVWRLGHRWKEDVNRDFTNLRRNVWRLGRGWKFDVNRDCTEFEGEICGDLGVDGRKM